MPYYPKNKIQTNLYTSGNEFVYLSDRQPYVGSYYKLYNGKYFTGVNPDETPSLELIKLPSPGNDTELNTLKRLNLEGNLSVPYNPLFPTPQDYQNGEFTRYFLIRRNQLLFSEINKSNYDEYINKKPTVIRSSNSRSNSKSLSHALDKFATLDPASSSDIIQLKQCPSEKELNLVTNRCVKKCKPFETRNSKFRCVSLKTRKHRKRT